MKGAELKERRLLMGYSQQAFMAELGIKSRQTLFNWERSTNDLPRLVELAVLALEVHTKNRRVIGKKATPQERKRFEQDVVKSTSSQPTHSSAAD